jgi:hypothetical protein
MAPSQSAQQNTLLSLPVEIRLMIYKHLLNIGEQRFNIVYVGVNSSIESLRGIEIPLISDSDEWEDEWEDIPVNRAAQNTSILATSKQISEEALDILYGYTSFVLDISNGDHRELAKVGRENLLRIRSVKVLALPHGPYYARPFELDHSLWAPLLQDLREIIISSQQPEEYWGLSVTLRTRSTIWISWLEPILRFFAEIVTEPTTVYLYDRNGDETRQLAKEYFASPLKVVEAAYEESFRYRRTSSSLSYDSSDFFISSSSSYDSSDS